MNSAAKPHGFNFLLATGVAFIFGLFGEREAFGQTSGPTIIQQPASQIVFPGSNTTFTVRVAGQ